MRLALGLAMFTTPGLAHDLWLHSAKLEDGARNAYAISLRIGAVSSTTKILNFLKSNAIFSHSINAQAYQVNYIAVLLINSLRSRALAR